MEWPFQYHSKGRPRALFLLRLWSVVLLVGLLDSPVEGDSSPPVADVEDLFKDEGFLRMSRGGEAFGRRPPPPPLLNHPTPPHLSTQSPPRHFQTPTQKHKPLVPPHQRGEQSADKSRDSVNNSLPGRSGGESDESGGPPSSGSSSSGHPPSKPLEKDVNAVFSKVGSGSSGVEAVPGNSETGADSDAHPLLGITPAAPGDPFDFNPILSNPAVTRILAGSSGRIPQWEPTLPDLHDLIPEVNYTGDAHSNRVYGNAYNGAQSPGNPGSSGHGAGLPHNPKNPVFVPSPVGSRGSPTMYNMDQMTNNIAIPKHTLPNPSNLATSRSTIPEDNGDSYVDTNHGGAAEDRDQGSRYNPSPGSTGQRNHLDEGRREVNAYDDEDAGLNENKNYLGSGNGGEIQGKRGIYKDGGASGQEHVEENGPKYIVCDALCGAWKHQCKLMGILFGITSVLCLVFALIVFYSLHFGLKDFLPFAIILLCLFLTSASRAFILLSGWFCAPDSRPPWLPLISTLPSAVFTVTVLLLLRLARFPFPFTKAYTISYHMILILSLVSLLPPLALSLGASLHPPAHGLLSQLAWIFAHIALAVLAAAYLYKFQPFYSRLVNERATSMNNGNSNPYVSGHHGTGHMGQSGNGNNNMNSLKKRGFVVKWGCLQARAMFGAALLALSLCAMIIISVGMGRGECEMSSTWTGWVLSLCARMLEFAIVILLLLVTISSADVRFLSRLTRVPINKSNVGLMNADIFPTMVSSNTAVQRCIPMYSSNTRADVLGHTESRSSLRGKTFGERALPGERMGEYRSSVGRGLPLRLGNGPSHSLPGTPVDGFPQGLRLPEPAPASLLVTKVVFGTPAISREVNLNHQHDNPLLCTGGPNSKDERETSNIYASLESVKIASMVNAGSSTGSNHSGSDRVLLSAPRDYIYSISRDLTKTIDSIYDTSRPRHNMTHTMEGVGPPLAHTIEQIGSIPNLNGGPATRPGHFNFHPQHLHHSNGSVNVGRAELARTIDRARYNPGTAPSSTMVTPTGGHPGRNFVLQLGGNGSTHLSGVGSPPPYCSSESSHDVTPDSGIVSDMHSKTGRMDVPEVVYAREYRRNSIEDVRRLPILPLPNKHRTPGSTPLYDRTPTSPSNPSSAIYHSATPVYIPNPTPNNSIVGRVEHLLNQTEHILSRTESLDSNSHSAGLQRLLSHKEQLEHVEKLLAQAEYAIWVEKRNCTQQVSQMSPTESQNTYGYSHGHTPTLPNTLNSPSSTNSANLVQPTHSNNAHAGGSSNANGGGGNSASNPNTCNGRSQAAKKMSKTLEEESVV